MRPEGANRPTIRFGGYFRIVDSPRPLGIMPLTRRLGDLLERRVLPNPDVIKPIHLRAARLTNFRAFGFKSQAEMDAAFAGEEGE